MPHRTCPPPGHSTLHSLGPRATSSSSSPQSPRPQRCIWATQEDKGQRVPGWAGSAKQVTLVFSAPFCLDLGTLAQALVQCPGAPQEWRMDIALPEGPPRMGTEAQNCLEMWGAAGSPTPSRQRTLPEMSRASGGLRTLKPPDSWGHEVKNPDIMDPFRRWPSRASVPWLPLEGSL